MKFFLFSLFTVCCFGINSNAQVTLPDSCIVKGYFFNSVSTSREINMTKKITQVAPNRYEVLLGDLTTQDYRFQFEVDANNNLVNWSASGAAAAVIPAPASGFMTIDNPGGFFFPDPGTSSPGFDYNHYDYANKYDSVTRTIYMHYGYGVGSTGEAGFTRQVYEKWQLPAPHIFSFTPSSGTSLTEVTISGKYFSSVPAKYDAGVLFGGEYADSLAILSDTTLKAWLGFGKSGKIRVYNSSGVDSSAEAFLYTAPPLPVIDTQWRYLGAAGFSDYFTPWVNIACGTNHIPYVVYRDSLIGKAVVKKYDGTSWTSVGSYVSDGNCGNTKIVIDNNNLPVVVYQDSVNNNKLTVKKFNGTTWATVGLAGFALWDNFRLQSPAMAIDAANNIYVLSIDTITEDFGDTYSAISLYKFNGTAWATVGAPDFALSYQGNTGLVIDRFSNTPYVVYDINTGVSPDIYPGQASVKKFDGTNWVQVGQTHITTSAWRGIYYPDIAVDRVGVPYICVQDDNGFERESVFKFTGGSWTPVGSPRFSKGHTNYGSLAIDSANNPVVLYRDYSYNRSGSVVTWNNTGSWNYVGERGFAPSQSYDEGSLMIDYQNSPMIAFGDYLQHGKASVMIFKSSRVLNDSLCANGNIALYSDNTTSGNTYRWQIDNGTGFINVVNNAVYNGATTSTLNIQAVPSGYYGYQYRCIIQNGVSIDTGLIHTLHFSNTWTGTVSSVWENPANWSCNVVPDANTDVIINSGTVVVSSNPVIRTLTLGTGVIFTVGTGFNLTITH